jgi:hypothetical protein
LSFEASAAGAGFVTKSWNCTKIASGRQRQVSRTSSKYYVFVGRRINFHLQLRGSPLVTKGYLRAVLNLYHLSTLYNRRAAERVRQFGWVHPAKNHLRGLKKRSGG